MENFTEIEPLLTEAQEFLDSAPLTMMQSQVLDRNVSLIKAVMSGEKDYRKISDPNSFIAKFEATLKKQKVVQELAVAFTDQMGRTPYPSHDIWDYMTEWPYGRSLVLYKGEYWTISHATEDALSLFHPSKGTVFIGNESINEACFVEPNRQ